MSKWKTHRVVIELPIRGNISEQDFKHFIKELCNEHVSLDRLQSEMFHLEEIGRIRVKGFRAFCKGMWGYVP
jgi:hypothetical protein